MPRATNSVSRHARRTKILDRVKGFYGRRKNTYRVAKQAADKSAQYAYRDRKQRKRSFRSLWIQRINAAARHNDMSYATFMYGLSQAEISIDRKILADIAVRDPAGFKELVEIARKHHATT